MGPDRPHVLKETRGATYSIPGMYFYITVLASTSNEGRVIDVLVRHRNLPERIEDIDDARRHGPNDGVRTGF